MYHRRGRAIEFRVCAPPGGGLSPACACSLRREIVQLIDGSWVRSPGRSRRNTFILRGGGERIVICAPRRRVYRVGTTRDLGSMTVCPTSRCAASSAASSASTTSTARVSPVPGSVVIFGVQDSVLVLFVLLAVNGTPLLNLAFWGGIQ